MGKQQQVAGSVGPHSEYDILELKNPGPTTWPFVGYGRVYGLAGGSARVVYKLPASYRPPPQDNAQTWFKVNPDAAEPADPTVIDAQAVSIGWDGRTVVQILAAADGALPPLSKVLPAEPQIYPGSYVEIKYGSTRVGTVLSIFRFIEGHNLVYEIWSIRNDATFPRSGNGFVVRGFSLSGMPNPAINLIESEENTALAHTNAMTRPDPARWVMRYEVPPAFLLARR